MTASREMPKYKCHKKVWALKIKGIIDNKATTPELAFEDEDYAPLSVDWDWYYRHKPQAGGYYVVYADGYKSYSTAQAFESGYTRIDPLSRPAQDDRKPLSPASVEQFNGLLENAARIDGAMPTQGDQTEETNRSGYPVKNAAYWRREYRKLVDDQSKRIAELEDKCRGMQDYSKYLESRLVATRLAGFNECKEAAVKVCDAMSSYSHNVDPGNSYYQGRGDGASDCAEEIRALTPSAPKGEQA